MSKNDLFGRGPAPPRNAPPPGSYNRPPPQRDPRDYNRVQQPPSGYQDYPNRNPNQRLYDPAPEKPLPSRRPVPGSGGGPPERHMLKMKKLGRDASEVIYENFCMVTPQDFPNLANGKTYLQINGQDVYKAMYGPPTLLPEQVAIGGFQRDCRGLRETEVYPVEVFNQPVPPALVMEVGVSWMKRDPNNQSGRPVPPAQIAERMREKFFQHIFSPGQRLGMLWYNEFGADAPFELTIDHVLVDNNQGRGAVRGILNPNTEINVTARENPKTGPIKLEGDRKPVKAIVKNVNFEELGIGGLDKEFSTIFRRAFASRVYPPDLVEKMGIQHVKGILLHGPPGTGKTLIARQIGKMLNVESCEQMGASDVLSKFVGESEKNLKEKFAKARAAQDAGQEGLHMVIFDELDAVCKQRGSGGGGGTGVGDSIVNTLLTILDGVEQLNNLLFIGMTNRKDMIDEALLRPGRLELHLEISLPDEFGRGQIIKIHTQNLRSLNKLGDDVDVEELARLTKNYSGAELSGLIRAGISYAFTRTIDFNGAAGIQGNPDDVMLTRADLMQALEDVKPAYGVSEEELDKAAPYGIIHYSPNTDLILRRGFAEIRALATEGPPFLSSILIHGPSGSGKTALAAEIGRKSDIPFVKMVRPIDMGTSEPAKLEYLRRTFADAYKSQTSLVILDDIEDLIEYNPIGPRFSNAVVQYLGALLRTNPPADRRILIVATSSDRDMLRGHRALRFLREIPVPAVQDMDELRQLLLESGHIPDRNDVEKTCRMLSERISGSYVGLGIKTIFSALQIALVTSDHTPLPEVLSSEIKDAMVDNGIARKDDYDFETYAQQ